MITEEKVEPTFDMLKNHRAGDLARFSLWVDTFFRGGFGTVQFRSQIATKTVSEIMTVYDEAFIVCVIHNAFDRWVRESVDIAKFGKVNKEIPLPSTKWTDTGSAAKKYEGWDEQGISFFNKEIMELKKLRDTQASKDLEIDYLDQKKLDADEKKRGGVKRITTSITAMNGLDDDSDDDDDNSIGGDNNGGDKRRRVSFGSETRGNHDDEFDNEEDEDDDDADDEANSNVRRVNWSNLRMNRGST